MGGAQPYHRAVGEADDHLHREVVFLQVQLGQLAVELILSVALQGDTKTTHWHTPEVAEWHRESRREGAELLCSAMVTGTLLTGCFPIPFQAPSLIAAADFLPRQENPPHHSVIPALPSLQLCD